MENNDGIKERKRKKGIKKEMAYRVADFEQVAYGTEEDIMTRKRWRRKSDF
jgi:hypothetical protein